MRPHEISHVDFSLRMELSPVKDPQRLHTLGVKSKLSLSSGQNLGFSMA